MDVCTNPTSRTFSVGPFNNKTFYDISESSSMIALVCFNSYEDRLQKFITQKISEINEVEYIYCQREEHAYFIWILINELNPEIRREIYNKQREVIRMFREEIFDFYVIARMNKPADSIINQKGVELIYQK